MMQGSTLILVKRYVAWLDHYTDALQTFLHAHVVLAPLLLLLIEEMGLPILVPGDAIIAYVGYGVSKSHTTTLLEAVVVALMAVLVGASVLFYISRRWGKLLLGKLGKFIFLKPSHMEKAERLFQKYGFWTIIFGRHIPGMRIPITIFAASSGVRYRTFILSTFVSTVAWIIFYLKVGSHLGAGFSMLFRRDVGFTIAVFAGLILLFVGLHFYGMYRERSRG
jgi:membrane protein DedA with SNARE-associated domain